LTIALSAGGAGEGIIGFSGTTNGRASRATTRLLDATFPPYRSLLPSEWASSAEIAVPGLVEAVKRVALVTERNAPVRMEFGDGTVSLTAGGDDEGRAEEQLEVSYDGEPITTAFNPQFLLDGLGALTSGTARMLFTSSTKPVVLRPAEAGVADDGTGAAAEYTYLIMPVRLPG
jgi:DNA polymerase-3 subunit beta